jgi:transcriptional regulator with XRE-family HTH domain
MRVIEFHRRQQKLSQAEFATLCGIGQKRVSDIELGRRPTDAEAAALERTLGLPVKELLRELPEDVIPPPPSMTLAILAYRERQAQEEAARQARRPARARR